MAEPKGPGEPRKGRTWAVVYLLAAIVAAIGTAVLLTRYMDARVAAVRVPTEKIYVAAVDLPVGTVLRPEMVAVVEWPVASMPEGTTSTPQELTNQTIDVPVTKGEPILRSKLASSSGGRSILAALLKPGMRAVAVRVDDVVGVAGFIHPGDHVDVIVTMKFSDSGEGPLTSKTILQNIRVLAVGKELESRALDPHKPLPATVATLMVDADQAEKLAFAAARGQILIALRGGADHDLLATHGAVARSLHAGSPEAAPPPPVVYVETRSRRRPPAPTRPQVQAQAQVQPPPSPPRPSRDVEILRGDLYEKRDFEKGSVP